MARTLPFQFFGIWVSGDIDETTIYTDRFGRKVWFPKAPPDKPPSSRQVHQRARFQTAQQNWKALTADEKLALETITLASNIIMTGQNLYISVALRNDSAALATLSANTKIAVPVIPFVP